MAVPAAHLTGAARSNIILYYEIEVSSFFLQPSFFFIRLRASSLRRLTRTGRPRPQPKPTVLPPVLVTVSSTIGIGWACGRPGRTSDWRSTVKHNLFHPIQKCRHSFSSVILFHPSSGIEPSTADADGTTTPPAEPFWASTIISNRH